MPVGKLLNYEEIKKQLKKESVKKYFDSQKGKEARKRANKKYYENKLILHFPSLNI